MAATDYTVGWICATVPELEAATAFLDKEHKPKHSLADKGILFVLGRIGEHNIVIGSTTCQVYGLANASGVAIAMLESFPSVRLALLVGIGWGLSNDEKKIRRGDVVVGQPQATHGGILRCTLRHDARNHQKITLQESPLRPVCKSFQEIIQHQRNLHALTQPSLEERIEAVLDRKPSLSEFARPAITVSSRGSLPATSSQDHYAYRAGETSYSDIHDPVGAGMDNEKLAVHYGTITSASSTTRPVLLFGKIVEKHTILCFEMEAVNSIDQLPCIFIRGIYNSTKSPKVEQYEEDRRWQKYAALTASAYAKGLLQQIPAMKVNSEETILETLAEKDPDIFRKPKVAQKAPQKTSTPRQNHVPRQLYKARTFALPLHTDDHLFDKDFQHSCQTKLEQITDNAILYTYLGTLLQSASFCGDAKLIEELINREEYIINAVDYYCGTALQLAAAGGNLDIVKRLLAKGADIDARGRAYGSALQAASLQNNVDIVRILLEDGADVNMKGGFYGTALQTAIRQNNFDVIRVLLQYKADITLGDGFDDAPLEMALEGRKFSALWLMLKFNAAATIPRSFFKNAIVIVSEEGQYDIVKLLLESGVTVDRQNPELKAAQAAASERGWHDIVQLLADYGRSYIDASYTQSVPLLEKDDESIFDRDSQAPQWSSNRGKRESMFDGEPEPKSRSTRYVSAATTKATGTELNPASSELIDHEAIRNALESNGATRDACSVVIHLSPLSFEFYKEQVSSATNLRRLVTLTGSPTCAQATSCEDLVEQHWGSDGIQLLDWMAEYLSTQSIYNSSISPCRLDRAEIDVNPFITIYTTISIRGSQIRVVSIIQQIMWLTAVLSKASLKRLITSSVKLRPIPILLPKNYKSFKIEPLVIQSRGAEVTEAEKDNISSCWHRLFHGTVLASGFAISERSQGKGVEIPFELMVNMADITAIVPREGGSFFLTGRLVTLFPTAKLQDGIQWHAIANDDMEELANISDAPDEIKGIDVGDFCSYRTFLGFYEKAEVLLGTKSYTETNQVKDCGLDVLGRRIELVGEGTYSLGVSIKGIVNGTVGGKWSFSKDHEICLSEYRDYFDRLEEAQRQPLIVYDTMNATGWLVSELSMVLQLALTYLDSPAALSRYRLDEEHEEPVKLPYALPCADGGSAALSVCQRRENHNLKLWNDGQGKAKRFGSYLDDVLKELGALKTAVKAQRLNTGFSIWPLAKEGLQGFDFHSLATRNQGVRHRELQSPGTEVSWWKLQHVHGMLVIFGSGFDKVICPSGKTSFPREQAAPYQANLLVASTPCVEALLKEKSGHLYFGSLVWNRPERDQKGCNKGCDGSSCLTIQHLGVKPCGGAPPPKNRLINKSEALVFGDVASYHAALRGNKTSQAWGFGKLRLDDSR